MRGLALASVALAATGCLTSLVPHSFGAGITADALPVGAGEVSVSPGLTYGSITEPTTLSTTGSSGTTNTSGSSSSSQATTENALGFPAGEGNLAAGISDLIGINLHLSPAGLQPGLKISMKSGPITLAVLPEFALGYSSIKDNTPASTGLPPPGVGSSGSASSTSLSAFDLLVGAKVLVSSTSGIYGSFGYDFQRNAVNTNLGALSSFSAGGAPQSSSSSTSAEVDVIAHNLTANLGVAVPVGPFTMRPELDFIYSPALSFSSSTSAGGTAVSSTLSGGSFWAMFANITFAIGARSTDHASTTGDHLQHSGGPDLD